MSNRLEGIDSHEGERAQGIHCEGLAVALPYSWARAVVDSFELSGVPHAPPWLAGAANVDGRIVAVVDLARWACPSHDTPAAATPRQRLLLGGEGAQAFALRFQGLPALLRGSAQPAPTSPAAPDPAAAPDAHAAHAAAWPEALQAFVRGTAHADNHPAPWPVLDMPALTRIWAAELAA